MGPTEKQIHIIDTIQSILNTWKNTNDIDSPSHTTYIDDTLFMELAGWIGEFKSVELEKYIKDLLHSIRTTPKYSIGDEVTIKSLDWYNSNKGENEYINDFVGGMSKYCGQKATIIEVLPNGYFIDIDSNKFYWNDDMFED